MWILIALALFAVAGGSKNTVSPNDGKGPRNPASAAPELSEIEVLTYRTYTIVVGKEDDGSWDWRTWSTDVFESIDDLDGTEAALGFDSDNREQAIARAKAWVDQKIDAADRDRQPVPPMPSPVSSTGAVEALSRRGLRMSGDCGEISVTSLADFSSHAINQIRAYDVENPNAAEIMERTFDSVFPECGILADGNRPSIRGRPWATVQARVQSVIDKVLANDWLSVAPAEEVLAARMVDMSAPSRQGAQAMWITDDDGTRYSFVSLPDGDAWRWWVWEGSRGDIDDALVQGATPSRKLAESDARTQIGAL